ncbi:hypothetical protein AAZX31_03G023800 [Glycine max]|nr:hypothetical protein JHK86_006154 [Glycine max]
MKQKTISALVIFIMAYGLTTTTTTFTIASQNLPAVCNGYEPVIDTCKPELTALGSELHPSDNCCFGSYYAFNLAMLDKTGKGILNMCDCFQFATKSLKYDPYKIIKLPGVCRLKINFPISMCVFWPTAPPTLVPKQ